MKTTVSPSVPPAAGEAAHTPTPWHTKAKGETDYFAGDGEGVFAERHADGSDYTAIIRCRRSGDAAFIVRACNSFAPLIAELERQLINLEGDLESLPENTEMREVIEARIASIHSALTAAKA